MRATVRRQVHYKSESPVAKEVAVKAEAGARAVAARLEREAAAKAGWAEKAVVADKVEEAAVGAAARRKSAQTIQGCTHTSKKFH